MIVLIDNFDSFTYNLVQAFGALGEEVEVVRNDVPMDVIESFHPSRIVISPGPKRPDQSGLTNDVLRRFRGDLPILGVCLGHQAIAEVFGGSIKRAERIMHGKTSPILHDGQGIFKGLPSPLTGMRYHSLIVDAVPHDFAVSARTQEGEVMGLRHPTWPMEGVQFHPESYRTNDGLDMLENFLQL